MVKSLSCLFSNCTCAAVALPGDTSQRRVELTQGFDCSAHSDMVALGDEK
jgi:hypothetical protein